MKKFKEFYMPVNSVAMAKSIIAHAEIIGYNFTNVCPEFPTRVKFYSNGNFSIVDDSIGVDGEMFCWYKFFELTPEDVVVEPERFSYRFYEISPFGPLKEYKLTKDQIERIIEIAEEEKS